MKLSEFEEKLANLPDERLRQMLTKCRKEGPEVAVKLILAESLRRGMDGMDEKPAPQGNTWITQAAVPEARSVPEAGPAAPAAEPAVPKAGPATPVAEPAVPEAGPAAPVADPGVDFSAPAFSTTPAWLSEESSPGLSPLLKVVIFLLTFSGVIGILVKIFRKG